MCVCVNIYVNTYPRPQVCCVYAYFHIHICIRTEYIRDAQENQKLWASYEVAVCVCVRMCE